MNTLFNFFKYISKSFFLLVISCIGYIVVLVSFILFTLAIKEDNDAYGFLAFVVWIIAFWISITFLIFSIIEHFLFGFHLPIEKFNKFFLFLYETFFFTGLLPLFLFIILILEEYISSFFSPPLF